MCVKDIQEPKLRYDVCLVYDLKAIKEDQNGAAVHTCFDVTITTKRGFRFIQEDLGLNRFTYTSHSLYESLNRWINPKDIEVLDRSIMSPNWVGFLRYTLFVQLGYDDDEILNYIKEKGNQYGIGVNLFYLK